MASDDRHRDVGLRLRLRGWGLWSVPGSALLLVGVTDLAAVFALVVAVVGARPSGGDFGRLVLLFALSAVFAEGCDRVDRIRRFLGSDRAWVNATSVWSFAAVLSLPAGYAALLVAAIFGHTLVRSRRHRSVRPYRLIFTAATMVLATLAAAGTVDRVAALRGVGPHAGVAAAAVLAAMIVFHVVNQALVGVVIYLVTRPPSWRSVLISGDDRVLEMVTLILGMLTAQTVLHSPWLTPGVLAVIAVLYRSSLVGQLQSVAASDVKTGLLNAAAWRDLSRRALSRAARAAQPAALLLIDLDHFKQINDSHGHLAGDRALCAVAACLQRELRGHDAVGRFGGEEFVVLIENVELDIASRMGERVRAAISEITTADHVQVRASVGLAHSPTSEIELDALLQAADTALYQAKAAGRNRVRTVIVADSNTPLRS
jgi:diguanylate cyclase (GGDEF)-like protein